MQKYINDIIGTSGSTLSPITGATCSVYLTGTSTLATLYSDNGVTPKANPISSSSTGRIEFYAADGRYDISVVKSGYTTVTLADILLEDLADATPGVFTTLSATGNAILSGATAEIQFTGATYGWIRATVGHLYVDAPTTKSIFLRNAGSTIATVSSTGLAISGTLSATGDITLSGTVGRVVSDVNSKRVLIAGGSSASTTTGAYAIFEGYDYGGAGAGGAISLVSAAGATNPITMSVGGTTRGVFSSIGLAVTGTLSATGLISTNTTVDGVLGRFRGAGTKYLDIGTDTTTAYIDANNTSSGIGFKTNGTTQAILDTSGNLGLGVTPSAWSGQTALQIASSGAIASSNSSLDIYANAYYNAGNKYIQSSYASRYTQTSGQHQWYNAPSGTAGNAITFTQAMTLDASGNLLVGTTTSGMTAGGVRLKNGGGNLGEIALSNNSGVSDYVARFFWGSSPTLVGNITVSSTATAFNTSSDRRLKDNITDADSASDLIGAIKVRQFDWKTDGTHQRFGMIAQELCEIAPEAVHAPADPDDMMSVDYSKLVPMFIKAIQELSAKVAALEAK